MNRESWDAIPPFAFWIAPLKDKVSLQKIVFMLISDDYLIRVSVLLGKQIAQFFNVAIRRHLKFLRVDKIP